MIHVENLKKTEEEEWDKLVESSPHATLFHKLDFLKPLAKHTKSELALLVGYKKEEKIGGLPIFIQKRSNLKMALSPPREMSIPYLGPILRDWNDLPQYRREPNFHEFIEKADEFLKTEFNPSYISISTPPNMDDARPFKWAGYEVEPMYNYLLDLRVGKGKLWEGLKKKLRQDITRTKKRGITVEEGGKKEFIYVYEQVAERYAEQGKTPSLTKEFLLDVYKNFHPENLRVFVAKFEGQYAGGVIEVYFNDRAESWVGSTKVNVSGVSPNDLIQWQTIEWAAEHGLKDYIIIGANTPRLSSYKLKFNPNPSIYFSAKKYSSAYVKLAEHGYKKILRPLKEKIR
ncbi:MAG: GNAT family N-acetyltransferase [Candidatus Altiarchaeota archaeon]